MDPITIGLVGYLAYKFLNKKDGEDDRPPEEQPGAPTTTKPDIPGQPSLTITDINNRPGQFLDNVKYSFSAGGQSIKGKHQTRKEDPITETLGNFMVISQTDPNVRPGEKKPDTVMIIVKDSSNRTIIAKRIIVGTKQIIDIQ